MKQVVVEQVVLRVRAERLARRWTLHQASRKADVWGPTLSNIERGAYRPMLPTSSVLQRLAKLYGVPVEDLLKPVSEKPS